MKKLIIILIIASFTVVAKDFIVQKPIIFLTTPEKSRFEEPVSLQSLIEINSIQRIFLDKLKYNDRKSLVSYALKFNKKKGIGKSKKFRNDCSGFTRKVFYKFNIELFRLPESELIRMNGTWINGVELIWKYVKKHGNVFTRKTPKAGDLVFFDNTHDRNKNGKYDDYFTHIGIVVKVDKDKTVHYIHKSNSGIKISKLNSSYENKYKKGKKIVNSYLRKKGTQRLSGQLVRGYGSLYSTEERHGHTSRDESVTRPQSTTVTRPQSTSKGDSMLSPKKSPKRNPEEMHGRVSQRESNDSPLSQPYIEISPISPIHREKIVKKAVSYLGKKIKKEDFAIKVYSDLGFGILDKEFNDEKHTERAIFWSFKKNGRLFSASKPQIGDLIFFDKLNGKKHFLNIAIIEKVDKNQIKFIYSSNGVIKRAYLNNKLWKTHKKNKQIINTYFIKEKNSKRKLSSQFFRRFGSLFTK